MKARYLMRIAVAAAPLLVVTAIVRPGSGAAQGNSQPRGAFAQAARAATEQYKSIDAATAAGYGLLHGCVSGPQEGSMGVHYANPGIVGDGAVDAARPEALLYEVKDGKHELVGVEYVVIADAWNAQHEAPPVLMGQLFNLVSAPNRYGLPAFYELHVWAWRNNPLGTFADWNPTVTCEDFQPQGAMHEGRS